MNTVMKKLEDIEVGDKIKYDGEWVEVFTVDSNDKDDPFYVKREDYPDSGFWLDLTLLDINLEVQSKEPEYKSKPVEEVVVGDVVRIPNSIGTYNYFTIDDTDSDSEVWFALSTEELGWLFHKSSHIDVLVKDTEPETIEVNIRGQKYYVTVLEDGNYSQPVKGDE